MARLAVPGKHSARLWFLVATVAVLAFASGCGSSGPFVPVNGSFSNASLKGQYAFTLRGIGTPDLVNSFFFVEGGVFTADGNGNVTSVQDDSVIAGQLFSSTGNGTYNVNRDGTADILFNFSNGSQSQYRLTLSDTSHFYMEQDDGFATSGGSGEKQDTSAFANPPSGTFVFGKHDLGLSSKVGTMTLNAGQISGTEDVLLNATLSSGVAISGTAVAPGSTSGRGTMTLTDSTGTASYIYYVVNATKFRLLNTNVAVSLEIGQAEAQSAGPFSMASLKGTYVFGSAGEQNSNGSAVNMVHSVGLFATDGAGNVSSGNFDIVQLGTPQTNLTLSPGSTYTVDASGRAVVNLNLSSGVTNQKVMWLVSPSRAYFLVNDPSNLEDGTADLQQGSAFTNSNMSGQYAFAMSGLDLNQLLPFLNRVGTWIPNGKGSVSSNYVASGYDPGSATGSANANTFTGSYSVGANGRTTASLNGLSSNLIFYMVSSNSGYILQADSGVDIGGAFTIQQQ